MPVVHTPQSRCRLGVARRDVTPPVGIYHRMWGAATHERATGVHWPLTATALVLQAPDRPAAPETEQVIIAVDHCLLWAREMNALLARVSSATNLASEQLLVAFSHTHSAGLMDLGRAALPGGELIGPYLEALAERIAAAIIEARQGVQPATIVYGTGRCSLAAQRDFWDEESRQFVCGFNPSGQADDTVLVARASDSRGNPLATIVNYACHPTTLAWENTRISPDYVGAMREVVETSTRSPCVFLQGASGDLGPREGFVGDTAVADRNGRQLGFAALAALESLPPPGTAFRYTGPIVSGATLGTWAHTPLAAEESDRLSRWKMRRWTVDLPYRPELPRVESVRTERTRLVTDEETARRTGDLARARDCRALIERADRQLTRLGALPPGPVFPLPVTLLQLGDAIWLGVEAEHYQLLQRTLRERFPSTPIVVMTLVNGSRASYLPTREAYGKGIYQETIAVLVPGCLELLASIVGDEVGKMQHAD